MTASEPLSLEEEYANQISWYEDPSKLTFIILDKDLPDTEGTGAHGGGMAGDCNIFFNLDEEEHVAEIEIMIAEEKSRGKGLATESLQLFMSYAASTLKVQKFVAKIKATNTESRNLFKKLGYIQIGEPNYFNEVRYELLVSDATLPQLPPITPYDSEDNAKAEHDSHLQPNLPILSGISKEWSSIEAQKLEPQQYKDFN